MRKNKIFVLLVVFIFINVTSVPLIFSVKGAEEPDLPTPEEFYAQTHNGELEGIDATDRFQGMSLITDVEPDTGNAWTVPVINDWTGYWEWLDFECVLSDEHANIWIGLWDDVWDGGFQDYYDAGGAGFEDDTWYFAYPWSSVGANATEWGAPDPDNDGYYLPPGYMDWITGQDLMNVMHEFETNIYPNDILHFGNPADRPGPLGDYKIQILIFNIRDGLYYDPIGAGWFIAGYFWSFASEYNDANIFHMDTYQWWRRQGYREDPLPYGLSPRSFEYEGTFAHEFQHLIHYDMDWDEYSWVNEGCSTLAEWICGYGVPYGHIGDYFFYFWDVSLVLWGTSTFTGLGHYGIVFLWTFYMYEHYGGADLIWALVNDEANGIEGWMNALAAMGVCRSFDRIFQDWAIANYIDDTSKCGGRYGYWGIDFPADSDGITLPMMVYLWNAWNPWFDLYVEEYPNAGYAYPFGGTLPYTPNYIEFHSEDSMLLKAEFDGDDISGVLAVSGEYKWHSGGDAWAYFKLGQTFDIPVGGATLNFMNYFEIEADWDFGYVEVHDLTTDEWYTLAGLGTTDSIGYNYMTDNPNCPGDMADWGIEPTGYVDAGRWNAFTGSSHGWYPETMDLSAFAGHQIELSFVYWTDPYTLEAGWYLDDIEIPELGFFDDVETDAGWTATGMWHRNNVVIPNNFDVTMVTVHEYYNRDGTLRKTRYHMDRMRIDEDTEEGKDLFILLNCRRIQTYTIMVVANQPGFEHTFAAGYEFTVDKPQFCKKWK
jgi:hypothetical protein